MEVMINERAHTYEPDFPEGWKFSSGDPFKFPVTIGNYACFIKLFRKPITKIPGWNFLLGLKGKNISNLPRVYDIQPGELNGLPVQFVFYEYLEGRTLDQILATGDAIDLEKLASGIFAALDCTYSHGFWFPDFCEKNIYSDQKGRFLLLDMDSCLPREVAPRNDAPGSKDYWSPVYQFYRDLVGYREIKTIDLPGHLLNILQLYLLVFRIHAHYKQDAASRNYSLLLSDLHKTLQKSNPSASALFRLAFPQYEPPAMGDISEPQLKAFVMALLQGTEIETGEKEGSIDSATLRLKRTQDGQRRHDLVSVPRISKDPISTKQATTDSPIKEADFQSKLESKSEEIIENKVQENAHLIEMANGSQPKKIQVPALSRTFVTISLGVLLLLSLGAATYFFRQSAVEHVALDARSENQRKAHERKATPQLITALTIRPATLTIIDRQVRAESLLVTSPITKLESVIIKVAGKTVPAKMMNLGRVKNQTLVQIFLDSTYTSGPINLIYPGLQTHAAQLTLIKVRRNPVRHFHAPLIVNLEEERRKVLAIKAREDSLARKREEQKHIEINPLVAKIKAIDFGLAKNTGLIHKIFAKRLYLIRGHGFLTARNGFEVYDMQDRLEVHISSDSTLVVNSAKKVHALLLKLVARGTIDTLWVKQR